MASKRIERIRDALAVGAVILITIGVWLKSPAWALIVLGVILLLAIVAGTAWGKGRDHDDT